MALKYHLKDNSFYYEGTDVPKNKLDIKKSELIHEIEKELLEEAYEIFLNSSSFTNFYNIFRRTFWTVFRAFL
jgi:cell filamentation protein